jgi:putative addiction module component (TIGR02574 family)
MVAKNLLNDVLALPIEDRREVYEELRTSLLNDPQFDILTDEQKRILDERLDEYEAGPNGGEPWDEVEARLLNLLKDRA